MACNCNNRNPKAWTDSNGCLRLNLDGRNFTYCPEGVSVACDPNGKGILINGQLCPFPEPGEASIVTDLEFNSDTNILTLRQENGPPVTVNLDDLADDHYVQSAGFDSSTSELVLNRTGDLPQIRVTIPTVPEGSEFDVLRYGEDGAPEAGRIDLRHMVAEGSPLPDDAFLVPVFYYNSAGELSASGALPITTVPGAYVIPTYFILVAGGVNRCVLQTNSIPRYLWFDFLLSPGMEVESAPVTVEMFRDVIHPLYSAIEAIDPIANPTTATVEDVATKVNEVIAALKELLP